MQIMGFYTLKKEFGSNESFRSWALQGINWSGLVVEAQQIT